MLLPLIGFLFGIGQTSTFAATRTWTGNLNNLWSVANNWARNTPPTNGYDVVFPPGATNKNNIKDNINLTLKSIKFTDGSYTRSSNAVTITNAVHAEQTSGASTINFNGLLSGPTTLACPNASASLALNGFLGLGNSTLTVTNAGDVWLAGQLSGHGGVVKQGSGTLTYVGHSDNIYTGPTDVRAGLLVVGKSALAQGIAYSPVTISNATVRQSTAHQIGLVPVTINKNGSLDLTGLDCTIANTTLNQGGDISTSAGTLSLQSGATITVNPGPGAGEGSTISGNLQPYGPNPCTFDVAPAFSIWNNWLTVSATVSSTTTLRKTGNGILYSSASNTFTGAFNVEAGTLAITHGNALGATSAANTISNNATLCISDNITVSGERLGTAFTYQGQLTDGGQPQRRATLLLLGLLLSVFWLQTRAQFVLNWWTVDDGGGTSTGGVYTLTGTIGQPDATPPAYAGGYTFVGGFWSIVAVVQMPGALYLTVWRTATNTVVVSWPLAGAECWGLQVTNAQPNISAAWPVIPPSYQTNGTNLQFI
jgi:autotransporter-associated beta strand protein